MIIDEANKFRSIIRSVLEHLRNKADQLLADMGEPVEWEPEPELHELSPVMCFKMSENEVWCSESPDGESFFGFSTPEDFDEDWDMEVVVKKLINLIFETEISIRVEEISGGK